MSTCIPTNEEYSPEQIKEQISISDDKFIVPERIRQYIEITVLGKSAKYTVDLTDEEVEDLLCEALAGYLIFIDCVPVHIRALPIHEYHAWLERRMSETAEGAEQHG